MTETVIHFRLQTFPFISPLFLLTTERNARTKLHVQKFHSIIVDGSQVDFWFFLWHFLVARVCQVKTAVGTPEISPVRRIFRNDLYRGTINQYLIRKVSQPWLYRVFRHRVITMTNRRSFSFFTLTSVAPTE